MVGINLFPDITMVDSGFWGGIDNGDEDSFVNILSILDFPMESLEGDGLAEDWDTKFQCLGPIPSEILRGLPPVPQVGSGSGSGSFIGIGPSDMPSGNLDGKPSQVSQQSTFTSSDCNVSGLYQTPSPNSVLENSSSSSAGNGVVSVGTEIAIPVRTRSKRVRRPTYNPWFVMTPPSPPSKISQAKKVKEKKRKRLSQMRQVPLEMDGSFIQRPTSVTKKCTHCEITKTPQWREGPMGPKTLCNACGVRYRSGRLFPEYRPAASPTFVPSLHSNSHRKVVEMRNRAVTPEDAVKAESRPPLSPPPEFVPMSTYLFDHI